MFQEIEKRGLIRSGISESRLNADVYELAKEMYGITTYWRCVTLTLALVQITGQATTTTGVRRFTSQMPMSKPSGHAELSRCRRL